MTQTTAEKIREILPIKATIEAAFMFEAKAESEEKDWLKSWLEAKAKEKLGEPAKAFLLSFHDDGVVWGKLENNRLKTSENIATSPAFRAETLQECRLFNQNGELLVWRVGENKFNARWIVDQTGADREYFDENQVLWGTQAKSENGDFTVVADGSEGLRHAFPQKVEDAKFKSIDRNGKEIRNRPLRLKARHYLDYDEDDCAFVSLSRLVNIEVEGE